MKWFLVVWVIQGGVGLSVTPMPSEKVCMKMATEVIDTMSVGGKVKAIAQCVEVEP